MAPFGAAEQFSGLLTVSPFEFVYVPLFVQVGFDLALSVVECWFAGALDGVCGVANSERSAKSRASTEIVRREGRGTCIVFSLKHGSKLAPPLKQVQ